LASRRGPSLALSLLLTHSVLTQVITFVLRPTAAYRALELGVPTMWLGVLSASFALAPLVLAIPAGRLVDRFGERGIMIAGGVLMLLSGLAFVTLGGAVAGLVLGSVLLGTGHLGCVVGQQALVANSTAAGRYDSAFGRYTFAASLGQAIGPALITGFGANQAIPDTAPIFVGTCALSIVLTALAAGLGSSQRAPRDEQVTGGMRTLLGLPGLTRALLTSCIVLAAVDITLVYLPALGTERGLTSGTVAALLAIRAAASMGSRLFLGVMARIVGRRRLLTGSTIAAALALIITPLPIPVWALGAALVVVGFGLGVGQPLTMSWLAESTPPGVRGRAMSLRLVGNRTGQVAVPSAAGLLAAGSGAGGVLWATAAALAWAGIAARTLPVDSPEPPDAGPHP
jgi:MFS family permease